MPIFAETGSSDACTGAEQLISSRHVVARSVDLPVQPMTDGTMTLVIKFAAYPTKLARNVIGSCPLVAQED